MQKILIFLLFTNFAMAQNSSISVGVSGFIRDSLSNEPLVGATIFETKSGAVGIANEYGFFSLRVPSMENLEVCFSYVGYQAKCQPLFLKQDTLLNIPLFLGVNLSEITISAQKNAPKPDLGKIEVNPLSIKKIPTLLGEPDVLKAIQILPGVSGGREGTSLLHIRGGSPDQTLILLDDVPIYYPVHIGGFASVFDANTINKLTLYKGGINAKYGNRGSGVLDIRLKEGHNKEWKKEVGVGLLASKIFVEGPIKKDTTTMMFAVRRSLIDIVSRSIFRLQGNGEEVGYTLSDAHFKIKHRLSQHHHLSASLYTSGDNILLQFTGGNDISSYKDRSRIRWGNYLASIQSQYFQSNYTWTQALIFTRFNYAINIHSEEFEQGEKSLFNASFATNIQDIGYKTTLEYNLDNALKVTIGADMLSHRFAPQIQSFDSNNAFQNLDTLIHAPNVYAFETNFFAHFDWNIAPNWQLNGGIRYTFFDVLKNDYRQNHYLQPRLLLQYQPSQSWSISAAYDKMNQFLHLLSNTGGGLPMDLWVPATSKALPESVHQLSAGIHFKKNNLKSSIEGYYKTLDNLVEFSEGVSFFRGNTNWENKIETNGKGISKGLEFLTQYSNKRFNATLAYTLSKTTRQFTNLNNNEPFPYRYDRRHDIAFSFSLFLKNDWEMTTLWVFNTGEHLTLAQEQFSLYDLNNQSPLQYPNYDFSANNAHLYNGRNGYQLPYYHRLDVNFQQTKQLQKGERTLSFGLYNAYNRINPYYVYFKKSKEGQQQLYKLGLFPILPFVSYVYRW